MTVTITGTINDVTARKDSRPWRVWSPVYRQGPGGEIVTVTPQPVKVVGGVVTIELEPGAAVIENPDGQRYAVTVPDEDANLWDIISAAVAFPPDTAAEALADAVTTYLEDNPPAADWNGLANKPAVVAEGSTQAIARSAIGAAPRITSGQFPWPPGLVALWDFQNDTAGGTTLTSKVGAIDHVLTAMGSKTVVKDVADPGPFGPSLVLDGATCFTKGPTLGSLDLSTVGDQVTVVTWVKDTGNNHDYGGGAMSFRAGVHTEGAAQARQYGLYFDGAAFLWGNAHLTPHIGAQDGPSPGYPWNHDYAASKRRYFTGTGQGQWHMEAMTFDGQQLIAYVDGITDVWQAVPEPPPEVWGLPRNSYTPQTLDRNPYILRKGLNRSSTAKRFTIGGAIVTTSPDSAVNFTTGKLGGVAVFNRALTATEIMQVRLMTLLSNEPISKFRFEVDSTGARALNDSAWFARAGAVCADVGMLTKDGSEYTVNRPVGGSTAFLTKTSSGIGAAWIALSGLNSSQVRKVTFDMLSAATTSAAQRLLVKVGNQWWASNTTYATTATHSGDTDWSGAETKTVNVNWDAGNWLPVTLQDSTTPTATTYTNLCTNPSLSVNATNWFKSGGAANATAARTAITGGFGWVLTWSATDSVTTVAIPLGGVSQTGVAVTAGNTYTASMQATSSKNQALYLEVQWYNASNALISSTLSGTYVAAAGVPITLAASGAAPATATSALVRVVTAVAASGGASWVSGDTLTLTKCLVVQGPLLPAYFDGDTAGGGAWTGSSGASTSTLSTTALPVATNLALNPLLKAVSTGWFTSGLAPHATGARTASGGGYVWRSTWTGADSSGNTVAGCSEAGINGITAGLSYTASVRVNVNRAQRMYLVIDWKNSGGTVLSSTVGGVVAAGTGVSTVITATGVAPASAALMLVRVVASGRDWASGDTIDLDRLVVVQDTKLPPSFIEGTGTYTPGTLSLGGVANTAWVDNDLITAIGFLSSGGDGSAVRVSNLALYSTGGVA